MTARDFRILITDRNPHVRDLLKREFAGRFVQVGHRRGRGGDHAPPGQPHAPRTW